jgi:hypothetical protein
MPLGNPRRRGKNHIKIDFTELYLMGRCGMDSTCSEQEQIKGSSETVMNIAIRDVW